MNNTILQKERYNYLKGSRSYTHIIPILSISILGFYFIVYIIRYLLWLYKQNKRKVRLLEYEKLRWLWYEKNHEHEQEKKIFQSPTLSFNSIHSKNNSDSDKLKEKGNNNNHISPTLPLPTLYHPFINDSNITLNNTQPINNNNLSRAFSLPLLKQIENNNNTNNNNSNYYATSTATLSSLTTLTSPPPLSILRNHQNSHSPSSASSLSIQPCPNDDDNHNFKKNQVYDADGEDDIISTPRNTSSSYTTTTTATMSTNATYSHSHHHYSRNNKSSDQSSWSFYDPKSKRQQMKYQWSVAMGYREYDHAKRITSIISQLESS
ncbi:hypothetical protein BJ944DRAFT_274288 [Cunninghamella echinulata]|nr:hypothetical protein BJ944DRAFT_274288 [Cunninghamella echinulata]